MRVATANLECDHDLKHSVDNHLRLIDQAADEGASLVVFPEISLQGYPLIPARRELKSVLQAVWGSAEHVPSGPSVRLIEERARTRRIHVVYGLTETGESSGVFYNTAVLTGPDGFIGKYRKVHLALQEQWLWRGGTDWPVYETSIGRIGMLICYDKMWPEATRELVLRGAEILVTPAAWGWGSDPEDRNIETNTHAIRWMLYDRTRAAENHRWLISSNYGDSSEGRSFLGHSEVVDPLGRIIATAGVERGMAVADIDVQGGIIDSMTDFSGARLIRDRRSETYAALRGDIPPAVDA